MEKKITIGFDAEIQAYLTKLNHLQKKTETAVSKMKGAFMALGGAAALGSLFKNAIDESIQAAKSMAMVEQAVRQTGGGAGYTAREFKNMADKLEDITAIDADQIMNDVTLQMLTFGKVSGAQFERAQMAALDLSAVLGSDLKSQTIQLGKALEDPIRGLTALRKSGIMFTEEQEKMIKNLVQHNDLAGAQALILDEVNSKYGGQAKAMADNTHGLAQAEKAWGNFSEAIGNAIAPLVSTVLPVASAALTDFLNLFKMLGGLNPNDDPKKRQVAYYEEIKNLNEDQLATEKEIVSYYYSENILKQQKLDKDGDEYKILQAQNKSYAEQMAVLNDIGKWEPKKITSTVTQLTDEEKKAITSANKEKESSIKKYYDTVKFLDQSYFDYRLAIIDKESTELKTKAGKEIDIEKYKIEEKKKLNEEYKKYLDEIFKGSKLEMNENGELQNVRATIAGGTPRQLKGVANESGKPDPIGQMSEDIMGEYIEGSALALGAYEGFIAGAMELTEGLRIKVSDTAGAGVRAFAAFGNSVIQIITQIIAKWAVLNLFSAFTGGGGIGLGKMLGFHNGGSVSNYGGGNVVPKFAGGVSNWKVPGGYPNDSYPVMVESGERLTVTPASLGDPNSATAMGLARVESAVKALNMTLIKKNMSVSVKNNIDGRSLTKDVVLPETKKLIKENVLIER